MKLDILSTAVCRTPVFSIDDCIEDHFDELKELISESSPVFGELISGMSWGEISKHKDKMYFTVWKYFNRARYRATPFGNFAAISVLPVAFDQSGPVVERKLISVVLRCWQEKDFGPVAGKSQDYFTNPTCYKVGEELRFILFNNDRFGLASVNSSAELSAILDGCRSPINVRDLYQQLKGTFNFEILDLRQSLQRLVKIGLLLTDRSPNITGQDYFERIGLATPFQVPPYVIARRKCLSGSLDIARLKKMPALLKFLATHLPQSDALDLQNFRLAFKQKFDRQAVPLALAMDPETGVGYGDLASGLSSADLPEELALEQVSRQSRPQLSEYLHQFLLRALIQGGPVALEHCPQIKQEVPAVFPNSVSSLLRFFEGTTVIESLGGCSANSLLGRFTIADEEVTGLAREISALEQRSNPGILFFDVAYQAEKQVDNVNRRESLYPHEFPILCWSCSKAPIMIDDILLRVIEGEVILWSRKFQQRMVPRIPSAYNYTRSDLALFRFFCDLQQQSLVTNFNLRINDYFPGLDYYPRTSYEGLIISPAKWRVPHGILALKSLGTLLTALERWLEDQHVTACFRVGEGDQTLCFEACNQEDRWAFACYCLQHRSDELYISEALISRSGCARDREGRHYITQYVLGLTHETTIYSRATAPANCSCEALFPGGRWVYFEIYCHPMRTNLLLTGKLWFFVEQLGAEIDKWFFIRYYDPRPHLRLRLRFRTEKNAGAASSKLKHLLDQECARGLISDIQLKTYFPEVARYGASRIELVEQLFSLDSAYALQLLGKGKTTAQLYGITARLMYSVITGFLEDASLQFSFVRRTADIFSLEFGMTPAYFKKVNQYFCSLQLPNENPTRFSTRYLKLVKQIMAKCNKDESLKLLGDLLHMHVNRLFIADQRHHEALLYQFLLKVLRRQHAGPAATKESRQLR